MNKSALSRGKSSLYNIIVGKWIDWNAIKIQTVKSFFYMNATFDIGHELMDN